jgi:hypothetical protein
VGLFGNVGARWRRRRRLKAAQQAQTPLREFVYLDEVSVYSLMASRQGAIPSDYTESYSETSNRNVGGKIAAKGGVVGAELGSQLESANTYTSQVVRKSTVQAAFKEFFEGEEPKLALSPALPAESKPNVRSLDDLVRGLGRPEFDGWIVDPVELERGKLVELEVELHAESIFRVKSIVSAMHDIFKDNARLFEFVNQESLEQGLAVSRVLDALLVGLVPIRGSVEDYRCVDLNGREVLVRQELLRGGGIESRSLALVGVTEEPLYWRDLRQVLFSSTRFRVLARLTHDGLREKWLPVKLGDVLREISPELGAQVKGFGELALSAGNRQMSDVQSLRFRQALLLYAARRLSSHGATVPRAMLDSVVETHEQGVGSNSSRRAAFQAVEELVQGESEPAEATELAELRAGVLKEVGLDVDGSVLGHLGSGTSVQPEEQERLMEVEVVAIYW